jgi:hypothetical protein
MLALFVDSVLVVASVEPILSISATKIRILMFALLRFNRDSIYKDRPPCAFYGELS